MSTLTAQEIAPGQRWRLKEQPSSYDYAAFSDPQSNRLAVGFGTVAEVEMRTICGAVVLRDGSRVIQETLARFVERWELVS